MFKDIKLGDKVIVKSWSALGSNEKWRVKEVIRVNTKTFKVEGITYTFKKDDGNVYGGNLWTKTNAIPYDEKQFEKLKEIEEKNEKRKKHFEYAHSLSKTDFSKLPTETLIEIYNIINKNNA